ncbi:hypothetical protein [Streptomyces olivaceus]|uniref:hypothetical protein n=1 Tax=Streptomyces olivaceus TaxID=47716 RepID=UPI001CCCF3BE|nr:hypothetical protein [Streptomyces olivaceus]MBZ6142526.1 hypothetical protein [Streptomyces olivaceus]MBZ6170105.1 hypothetical protein [Streptomyces olivaceus]
MEGPVHRRGLAKRADPQLAAWVDTFTRRRKTRYGWSKDLPWRAWTGTTLILGYPDVPGARTTAEDLHVLRQAGIPYAHVSAILEDAGLLTGERTPALTRWAHQLTAHLPEAPGPAMYRPSSQAAPAPVPRPDRLPGCITHPLP